MKLGRSWSELLLPALMEFCEWEELDSVLRCLVVAMPSSSWGVSMAFRLMPFSCLCLGPLAVDDTSLPVPALPFIDAECRA